MRTRHPTGLLFPAITLVLMGACAPGEDGGAWLSETDGIAVARSAGTVAVRDLLLQRGNSQAADGFQERRVLVDEGGETPAAVHLHVRQTHGGVPVWGGEAIMHLRPDGSVKSVTDDFLPEVNRAHRKVQPDVGSGRAIELALLAAGLKATDLTAPALADLWFLRHAGGDSLTWRVRLDRLDGTTRTARPVVFVDAADGTVLFQYDNLQTATGNSMYSGTVSLTTTLSGSTYQLKDGSRGGQQTRTLAHATSGTGTLLTDADDVWGDGTAGTSTAGQQTAAVDAQFGAATTWDYYKNVQGRSGIFNDGVGVPSRVHYGNNYVNAYWDGTQMTYGDGAGNVQPLTSIDVAGHEMSHGVTESTAGLNYTGEPGGLNEATSDIFGSCVEFYANGTADVGDYLIGEKIDINGDGTPLRYMDKPSKDGASPDCWSSSVGGLDVHYSSGPANHFFYLLAEGSGAKTINGVSYNSPTCNGTSVPGITRAKAEKIWYRALTTYMTASTSYAGARTATLSAAVDLYGASSNEYVIVGNTWAAIGVGSVIGGTDGGTGGTDGGTGGSDGGTGGSDGGTGGSDGGTTNVLSNGVPASVPATATGASQSYQMLLPAGATNLSFNLSGGTGDADLYVKFGSPPTTSSYDCRPYLSGNTETCSFATPSTGTYYVMIRAYSAYSGVSVVGSYTAGGGGSDGGTDGGGSDGGTTDGGSDGGANVLQNGVPASVPATATGASQSYLMLLPAGATSLSFALSGGTGDADLYVKFGSPPTTSSYDCRPYLSGNTETCSFATPSTGTYYVMVQAYSAYSGVSLVGRYTVGGGGSDGGTDGGSDGGTGTALQNGGFEGSVSPWVRTGTGSYVTTSGSYPHTGTGYAYLGYINSASGALYQQFTVPAGSPSLRFWLAVASNETTTATQYDKLFVEVRNTSGTLLGTLATYSNLNKTSAATYSQKTLSLAAYAGQTIRLNFRMTTDSSLVTTFRVDDVAVN